MYTKGYEVDQFMNYQKNLKSPLAKSAYDNIYGTTIRDFYKAKLTQSIDNSRLTISSPLGLYQNDNRNEVNNSIRLQTELEYWNNHRQSSNTDRRFIRNSNVESKSYEEIEKEINASIQQKLRLSMNNYRQGNYGISTAIKSILGKINIPITETLNQSGIKVNRRLPAIALKRGIGRDWWKLLSDFVYIYNFFSIAKKYSKQAIIRNTIISMRTKSLIKDFEILRNWIISSDESIWNDYYIFHNYTISLLKTDTNTKIENDSQRIRTIINNYIDNLLPKISTLTEIPKRIQQLLYEYIKDKAYFPKNYLSTYQINRLSFDLYGGTQAFSEKSVGMLVSFLIINVIIIQNILLHIRKVFPKYKDYPNIELSAKYIGSIMHYLTRDTFQSPVIKNIISLRNYYRNYHLLNEELEKKGNNAPLILDNDEYSKFLIPEDDLSQFWISNKDFIESFKKNVYKWACHFGKVIRLKYSKLDINLYSHKKKSIVRNKIVLKHFN